MILQKKRVFSAFLALLLLLGSLLSLPVGAAETYSDTALRSELSLLADEWETQSRSKDAAALRRTLTLAALSPRLEALYDTYPSAPSPDTVANKVAELVAAYYTPGAYLTDGSLHEESALQMLVRCYRAALNEAAWQNAAREAEAPEWREFLESTPLDAFLITLAEEQYERVYVKEGKYRPFAECAPEILAYLQENVQSTLQTDPDRLSDYAVRGYSRALGDAYARFYNPEEELERQKQNASDFVGIGVTMRRMEDGRAQVLYVNPDSPASLAGIKGGDLLTAVNGVTLTAENSDAVLDTLSGERGTSVSLTLERDGTPFSVTCIRNDVENVTVIAELLEGEACKIGYIRLTRFTETTYAQFKAAVEGLRERGAEGFLFDVRDNPG